MDNGERSPAVFNFVLEERAILRPGHLVHLVDKLVRHHVENRPKEGGEIRLAALLLLWMGENEHVNTASEN